MVTLPGFPVGNEMLLAIEGTLALEILALLDKLMFCAFTMMFPPGAAPRVVEKIPLPGPAISTEVALLLGPPKP